MIGLRGVGGEDAAALKIEQAVRRRAGELGLEIVSVGIRDVIPPGDMKDLMNKVTEAKEAAAPSGYPTSSQAARKRPPCAAGPGTDRWLVRPSCWPTTRRSTQSVHVWAAMAFDYNGLVINPHSQTLLEVALGFGRLLPHYTDKRKQ